MDNSKRKKFNWWFSGSDNMKAMTHYFVIRIDEDQLKKDLDSLKPTIPSGKSNISYRTPESTKSQNIKIQFEDPELNEKMSNANSDNSFMLS